MIDDIIPTIAKSPITDKGPIPQTLNIVLCTLVPTGGVECTGTIPTSLLSEAEQQRAARFVFERDRWSYAAAHSLLRAMLTELHGLQPLAWRFSDNGKGRPEIDPALALPVKPLFNISHTHGMASCAVTSGHLPEGFKIGVDVERLGRSSDSLALAERFFSPSESEWLRSLPESQLDSEFLRLWTLKEAVAKAVGVGLGLDFTSFHCSINPLSVSFDDPGLGSTATWELRNWFVDPVHWVSLAVQRPLGTIVNLTLRHLHGIPITHPE